jgi:rubrerythrin
MSDPIHGGPEEVLGRIVSDSAAAATHCLAAAERAVVEGRFNIAKVLRACAHSARVAALTAARLLAEKTRPADVVASTLALLEQQSHHRDRVRKLLPESQGTTGPQNLFDASPASAALEDVLHRALNSLQRNRDILESDVAQSLWGCQVCGAVVEGSQPQNCSHCGALRFEFEWFGPFYSGTFERLGRRSPTEIAAILTESPVRLASLLDAVDEEPLARRPSVDEWCVKEIAGHLTDVTQLFCWRVQTIQTAATAPSLDGSMPPWRLLEKKGYPDVLSRVILEDFQSATREAFALIQKMKVEDWGRFGLVRGRATTILDLGAWLANHNVAHFAQIEALREGLRQAKTD